MAVFRRKLNILSEYFMPTMSEINLQFRLFIYF